MNAEPSNQPSGREYTREINRSRLRTQAAVFGADLVEGVAGSAAQTLLACLGYWVVDERLNELHNAGLLTAIPVGDDAHLWSEGEILDLAESLESLREWAPFNNLHQHKKTPEEITEEVERHRHDLAVYHHLLELPLWTLLCLVHHSEVLHERGLIVGAIAGQLKRDYGIKVNPCID